MQFLFAVFISQWLEGGILLFLKKFIDGSNVIHSYKEIFDSLWYPTHGPWLLIWSVELIIDFVENLNCLLLNLSFENDPKF